MSITTIQTPDDLKEKVLLTSTRKNFLSEAEARYATIVASGKTIPWVEMQHSLNEKANGKKVVRPIANKQAR